MSNGQKSHVGCGLELRVQRITRLWARNDFGNDIMVSRYSIHFHTYLGFLHSPPFIQISLCYLRSRGGIGRLLVIASCCVDLLTLERGSSKFVGTPSAMSPGSTLKISPLKRHLESVPIKADIHAKRALFPDTGTIKPVDVIGCLLH